MRVVRQHWTSAKGILPVKPRSDCVMNLPGRSFWWSTPPAIAALRHNSRALKPCTKSTGFVGSLFSASHPMIFSRSRAGRQRCKSSVASPTTFNSRCSRKAGSPNGGQSPFTAPLPRKLASTQDGTSISICCLERAGSSEASAVRSDPRVMN